MLERDPAARLPAAVECYERGISLCGMSKALGMPGIDVEGYCGEWGPLTP